MERIAEPDAVQLRFGARFPRLVLASTSPNRKALLEKGGCLVDAFAPDADESRDGATPQETVERIAGRKIASYISSPSFNPSVPAIAADTLVLIDGELLGKPSSREDAYRMLRALSGRTQTVISSAGIWLPGKGRMLLTDEASVVFRALTDEEISEYISTGEWQGAAGGYRLQKTGFTLVERIDGDWTTVVGLPLKAILSKAE